MRDISNANSVGWKEGDALPKCALAPITRTMLALYAGGSGDHNPLHIDIDFARSIAKMDDVIGQGMLTMALVGRYVMELVSQGAIRSYSVRFTGMSRVGDRIECSGRVAKIFEKDGARCAELELMAKSQSGETLASGAVIVDVSEH